MRVDRASLYSISSSAKWLINRRAFWRKQKRAGDVRLISVNRTPAAHQAARFLNSKTGAAPLVLKEKKAP
jgi:hypothetical protein